MKAVWEHSLRLFAILNQKYEVRSLKFLVTKIIPHFRKYPMLSSKQKEFEKFALICKMMKVGKHKNKSSLRNIIDLAYKINLGRRRYNREQLQNLIR